MSPHSMLLQTRFSIKATTTVFTTKSSTGRMARHMFYIAPLTLKKIFRIGNTQILKYNMKIMIFISHSLHDSVLSAIEISRLLKSIPINDKSIGIIRLVL